MKRRVFFVTSHPIQYQAPVFRCLARMHELDFEVLFAMLPDAESQGEGFGVKFRWDIPLLDGYKYRLLHNSAANPGVTHFFGCDTPGIGRVLAELRPDVVIVNGWVVKTCLQTLWACKRLRIPCLVRGEANDLRPRASWKRFLQRLLVRQYAGCLYIGSANRYFYQARGIPDERLFAALYCVDNQRFAQAAAAVEGESEVIRRSWKIEPEACCFLFCGKFEPKKHPMELLEALRRAVPVASNLRLLMVGDGELRPDCEAFVQEHNLPVTFAGFLNQSEIVSAYVAADCLVLPSDAGETWGLVVNEAMACGRPAIVSDQVGCGADLVSPGVTGDIFPFGDWPALGEMLATYAADRSRLRNMGRKARMQMDKFSPQAAAEGIRLALTRMPDRRGVAGP